RPRSVRAPAPPQRLLRGGARVPRACLGALGRLDAAVLDVAAADAPRRHLCCVGDRSALAPSVATMARGWGVDGGDGDFSLRRNHNALAPVREYTSLCLFTASRKNPDSWRRARNFVLRCA